jgi:hypothetical protein
MENNENTMNVLYSHNNDIFYAIFADTIEISFLLIPKQGLNLELV